MKVKKVRVCIGNIVTNFLLSNDVVKESCVNRIGDVSTQCMALFQICMFSS